MWLILSVSVFLILSLVDGIQISTPQGDIIGTTTTTKNGREIYAFLGIPFGKPPVGELRFKNPEIVESWNGVLNATKDGEQCIQPQLLILSDSNDKPKLEIGSRNPKVIGSEDCLYLNVFTPNVEEPKGYPVMVNIHGGGFFGGSADSNMFSPKYLLDKNVVMISMNYRVGPLGFASTEDTEMSGNWGLKDQALALKWVQKNIAAYGGNPDSVTIFGISAGGASVDFNVISQLSKGLFHRAIAMGGSAHVPWGIKLPGEVAKRTKKLASLLDCPTEPSSLLVKCLRKVKPERFVEVQQHFLVWDTDPFVVFTPVVEPKGLEGAFLTESPGSSESTVPMIIGVAKDEGGMKIGLLRNSNIDERLEELDKNFIKYGAATLLYDSEGQMTPEMLKKIRKFYFGNKTINKDLLQSISDMYSDSWITYGTATAVRRHKGPTYLYMFTYKGDLSLSEELTGIKEDLVSHGEDAMYIFPFEFLKNTSRTEYDRKMVEAMVTMWTNFAIHGNPTPEGSEVIWNQVSKSEMNYLNIDIKNLKMKKHFNAKRDNFWQELFKRKSSQKNRKTEL